MILYLLAGLGGFILFNTVNYFQIEHLKDVLNSQSFPISKILQYSVRGLDGSYFSNGLIDSNINAKELQGYYLSNMVGASGAIYGLLLAFAVLYPDEKLMLIFFPVPIKAKYFIPIMVLIEFYMGYQNIGNVAHFAHLGGGLIGFLLARHWKKNLYRWN